MMQRPGKINSSMNSERFEIIENRPLKALTTFDAGGPARYFAAVSCDEDVVSALGFAKAKGVPFFVLGGGSNLLISDAGFPGLVIHNRIKGIESAFDEDSVIVSAGAGEEWPAFVDLCVGKNWQGIECLAGIPGTTGASPAQNIGAYGQDVSEIIVGVEAIDSDSGMSVLFSNKQCGFVYRGSIFNSTASGKYVITGVDFRLAVNGAPKLSYRELKDRLDQDSAVTLSKVRNTVIDIRAGKGLLSGEGNDSFKCAGSFFKNPVVPAERFGDIQESVMRAGGCDEWAWPLENSRVKLSAACLIQSAGYGRGYTSGNVGISPLHSLILINRGGAAAEEIVGLATDIKQKVAEKFGVILEPEVRLVGFPSGTLQAV
jgi:UDP-N-acetylmuramate dehydrogenase